MEVKKASHETSKTKRLSNTTSLSLASKYRSKYKEL